MDVLYVTPPPIQRAGEWPERRKRGLTGGAVMGYIGFHFTEIVFSPLKKSEF